MKLLRLAIPTFYPAPSESWHSWRMSVLGAEVETMDAYDSEGGGLRLLVAASVALDERPEVNSNGLVVIPEEALKLAEAAIETAANAIAVAEGCKRSISSPSPCVAFLPEDLDTRKWLDRTNGMLLNRGLIQSAEVHVDHETLMNSTSDRLDGLALLAEALAHDHATGKFHELLRLFERAFGLGPYELIQPLSEFLSGCGLGYTQTEVESWLATMRHPATHADRRPDFLLEADIRPVIPRMVQAAYDVLLNKDEWRTQSTRRREAWHAPAGTTSSNTLHLYVTQGEQLNNFVAQILDEVGTYPMALDAGLESDAIPDDWWLKEPTEDRDAPS